MTNKSGVVQVISCSVFNTSLRDEKKIQEGKTLAEIVAASLPGISGNDLKFVRLHLSNSAGMMVIDHDKWEHIKPKAGTVVVIRMIPGKDALQSVLQIVVSIAAVALGQFWGTGLLGAGVAGRAAGGVMSVGLCRCGDLCVNGLITEERDGREG